MFPLPEEIQVDIFLRLPLKLIARCRCVCKPWCTLLRNPKFINTHLKHSAKNPKFMLIIAAKRDEKPVFGSIDYASIILSAPSAVSSSSSITYTCNGVNPTPMDYLFQNKFFHGLRILGSCNGLICARDEQNNICIWNPSTGEYKIKPVPVWNFYKEVRCRVRYGFGYDSNIDYYKLVRIAAGEDFCYSQVEVYTLGSESLKTVRSTKQYKFPFQMDFSLWLLNGILHWAGFTENSKVIVSFDITSERFVYFVYPEGLRYSQLHKRDCMGLLNDRLCLIVEDIIGRSDVWLMQDYGVNESWTKLFSLEPYESADFNSTNLMWSTTSGKVLIDSGHKKLLYDSKNNETSVFKQYSGDDIDFSEPVRYVESLVSLNSGTFVGKRIADEVTEKDDENSIFFG